MSSIEATQDNGRSMFGDELEVDYKLALQEFNQILKERRDFKVGWSQDWGNLQWRDAISYTQVRQGLRGLTLVSGIAVLLVKTWDLLNESEQSELSATPVDEKLLFSLRGALDALFDYKHAPISKEQFDERLKTYYQAASQAMTGSVATESGEVDVTIKTTIPMTAGTGSAASVQRLWEQVRGLDDLINTVGRPTDEASKWKVWYQMRWEYVRRGRQALAEYGAWAGTKKIINNFLDVGLLPIMGHNIITFGKNVVAPWRALSDFSTYMVMQAMLYDLHDYGIKVMKLNEDSRLMRSVRLVIDQIDMKAIRYAFKVTPFALVISVYESGEWLGRKLTHTELDDAAEVVINHASRSGDTEQSKQEQHFARMVVMALMPPRRAAHEADDSQDLKQAYYLDYIRTMTEFEGQAYKDLASRMVSPKNPK